MIQRVQTLYLLAIVILMVITLFSPLATLMIGEQVCTFDATGISTTLTEKPELLFPTWGLFVLSAVIALIATAGLAMLIPVIFQDSALRVDAVRIEGIALFLGCLWLLRKKRCSPILVMVLAGALQAGLYALQQLV